MKSEMKIIDYLGDDENGNRKFVVLFPKEEEWDGSPNPERITIAHDYVSIAKEVSFQMEYKGGKYPYKSKGVSNWVQGGTVDIHIGIREMIDIVLPFLNSHKYLQKEHISDRIHDKDDEYFEKYDLKQPRWKKGDKYPGYCYSSGAIELWQDGNLYTYFRRCGESVYDKLISSTYDIVRSKLRLAYDKWQFTKNTNKVN